MRHSSIAICIFSTLFAVTTSDTGNEDAKYDAFYDAFIGLSTALTQMVGNDEGPDLKFDQKLDHFDKSNTKTWQQHYAMNMIYHEDDGPAIIFLTAQHSSPMELIKNDKYAVAEYAKELKAALFMLEHRYFGLSQPFKSLTNGNLKYLTTRQAVEDVAAFIPFANKKHNLGEKTKWIVIGGSYAGNLAAWVRQMHPELVVGAVASSAPMKIALDVPDYLAGLEKVLQKHEGCRDKLNESFSTAVLLSYDTDGRKNLSKIFKLKPSIEETHKRQKDLQFFFATLQAYLKSGLEYDERSSAPGSHIERACEALQEEGKNAIERLFSAVEYFVKQRGKALTRIKNDYDEFVNSLKKAEKEGVASAEEASRRSWLWLKCNELGLFQSTDYGKGAFGSTAPLGFWIEMCTDVFGSEFQIDKIAKAVEETREHYGVRDGYKGTNVVFTNGHWDPWLPLGIVEKTKKIHETVTLLQEDTTHCGDLLPLKKQDQSKLRKEVKKEMKKWLEQKKEPKREEKITYEDIRRSRHPLPLVKVIKKEDGIEEFAIEQPVDHFSSSSKTFTQHYWSNLKFYKSGGPRFLMIGGHSPASTMWLTNSKVQIMQLAEKFNAAVYLIEHRGYGKSKLDQKDQEYVTSEQAIVDIEQLIIATNNHKNAPQKWITFGGGYGGSIAAWSRMFRPELVAGAVASSAPVSPVLDFYKYLLNLQDIINDRDPECKNAINHIFMGLHGQLLDKESRANLSKILGMNPPWTVDSKPTPTDIQFFYLNLLSHFIAVVQFDGVNMELYDEKSTVKEACSILKSEKPLGLKLKEFKDYASKLFGKESAGFPKSYDRLVEMLKEGSSSRDLRSCFYQQCTEFGLFRTTDIGRNVFKSALPLNFFEELCTEVFAFIFDEERFATRDPVFGYHPSWKVTKQFVSKTADLFKENDKRNLQNVVLTYGTADPWTMGEPKGTRAKVIMIEDAAHMADMYPPRDSDVSSLKEARISVQKILDNWITGETIAPKPKPTTTPKPEPTTTSKPEPTTAPKPESTTASKPGPTTKKPRPKPTEEDETEGAAVSDISFVLLTLSAAVVFPQMN